MKKVVKKRVFKDEDKRYTHHLKKLFKVAYYKGVKAGQDIVENRSADWLEVLVSVGILVITFIAGVIWGASL